VSDEATRGGLSERPAVDPAITAVVTAAAYSILTGGSDPAPETPANVWRFSGRLFSDHQVRRRARPS